MPRFGLDVNVTEKINTSLDTHSQPHVTDFDNVEIADIDLLKERR